MSAIEIFSGNASIYNTMHTFDELSDTSHLSNNVTECPVDVGRVGSWTTNFSSLLEDPLGLYIFSEFLKKEFSQENLTFWIACEHYKKVTDETQMLKLAQDIYSKHLCIGALEPVNVDSHARQVVEENLQSPSPELFLLAQKQIFNLMKYDCYQRFLKSSTFKECMLKEMQGQPLPFTELKLEDSTLSSENSKSFRDFKKRKTLIPWHKLSKGKSARLKNYDLEKLDRYSEFLKSLKKKKKDKAFKKHDDASSISSNMSERFSWTSNDTDVGMNCKKVSSNESLNSAELTLFPNSCDTDSHYCRVILPDLSTTVVKIKKGETVGEMLLELFKKRCLTYNAVEAYLIGSKQPLDHGTDVASLCYKEIKVEQVILFCVELPNNKTIGVKAKNNKICADVIKPVLHKYGYDMDQVTLTVNSFQTPVDLAAPISSIDNQRIIVNDISVSASDENLDALTNEIFQDLLKRKSKFQIDGPRMKDSKNTFVELPDECMLHHGLLKFSENSEYVHNSSNVIDEHISFSQGTKLTKNLLRDFRNDEPNGIDNSFTSPIYQEFDIGLDKALQSIEQCFSTDVIYPAPQCFEDFLPKAFHDSNKFEKATSETLLQKSDIIPSAAYAINPKHALRSSKSLPEHLNQSIPKLSHHFVNHTNVDVLSLDSSSSVNIDSTLIDNDVNNVTLEVPSYQSAMLPDCFTPAIGNKIDKVEEEISEVAFSQLSLCQLSPPPVPPKSSGRKPPPRPPNCQFAYKNPELYISSASNVSRDIPEKDRYTNLSSSMDQSN